MYRKPLLLLLLFRGNVECGEVSQETGSAADSSAKVGYVPVLGQRHRPRKPSSSSSSSL